MKAHSIQKPVTHVVLKDFQTPVDLFLTPPVPGGSLRWEFSLSTQTNTEGQQLQPRALQQTQTEWKAGGVSPAAHPLAHTAQARCSVLGTGLHPHERLIMITRRSFTHPTSSGSTFSQGSAAPAFAPMLLGAAGRERVTCSGRKTQPGHTHSLSQCELWGCQPRNSEPVGLKTLQALDSCRVSWRTSLPNTRIWEFSHFVILFNLLHQLLLKLLLPTSSCNTGPTRMREEQINFSGHKHQGSMGKGGRMVGQGCHQL